MKLNISIGLLIGILVTLCSCNKKEDPSPTNPQVNPSLLLHFMAEGFSKNDKDTATLYITNNVGVMLYQQKYTEGDEFIIDRPDNFNDETIIVHREIKRYSYQLDDYATRFYTYRNVPTGATLSVSNSSSYNSTKLESVQLQFINVPENQFITVFDGDDLVKHFNIEENDIKTLKGVDQNYGLGIILINNGDSLFYFAKKPVEGELITVDMSEGVSYSDMNFVSGIDQSQHNLFFNLYAGRNGDYVRVADLSYDDDIPASFDARFPFDESLDYRTYYSYPTIKS